MGKAKEGEFDEAKKQLEEARQQVAKLVKEVENCQKEAEKHAEQLENLQKAQEQNKQEGNNEDLLRQIQELTEKNAELEKKAVAWQDDFQPDDIDALEAYAKEQLS